jgi:hypothetical protein
MAKKVLDAKAKAKKQKKIAIAGSVLFLALLAYQVPKTMKMLNQKPVAASTAPAPTPVTTPAPVTGTATPVTATPDPTAVVAGAPTGTGPDQIVVNADLSPAPLSGQLAALTQFTSKDPFRQQAATATVPEAGTVTTTPTAPATPTAPTTGGTTGGGSFTPGTTTPGPAPTLATLSVNGVEMAVTVKTDFPVDSPYFTLVSMTTTTVKIGIAGGSLANGSNTVTLKKGKPLTLMNTADGTRYVIVFVSVGDTTVPGASTTPTTGAPTTTTTTPTTTTPGK